MNQKDFNFIKCSSLFGSLSDAVPCSRAVQCVLPPSAWAVRAGGKPQFRSGSHRQETPTLVSTLGPVTVPGGWVIIWLVTHSWERRGRRRGTCWISWKSLSDLWGNNCGLTGARLSQKMLWVTTHSPATGDVCCFRCRPVAITITYIYTWSDMWNKRPRDLDILAGNIASSEIREILGWTGQVDFDVIISNSYNVDDIIPKSRSELFHWQTLVLCLSTLSTRPLAASVRSDAQRFGENIHNFIVFKTIIFVHAIRMRAHNTLCGCIYVAASEQTVIEPRSNLEARNKRRLTIDTQLEFNSAGCCKVNETCNRWIGIHKITQRGGGGGRRGRGEWSKVKCITM